MLNRQKTLLLLLKSARRPVSKVELTKWAFVLREEMPSGGGSAFYDFLPYRFGPFSFCLYREMDALVRDGYVAEGNSWTPTALADEPVQTLPKTVIRDGRRVVERFSRKPVNRVVDYVYSTYPRFTVNSEKKRMAERPVALPAVYTAGYERLSIDAFLDRLIRNGIQRIIDVRNNPVARRYGFHKSTLARLGDRVGIQYVHVPELGIQSGLRQNLGSREDYDALFDRYARETLADETESIQRVGGLMAEKASVLVCMEADPRFCHRSRLAEAVSQDTGLPIRDLGCGEHDR
jgi:uncharacterized protein (DUF488 family)